MAKRVERFTTEDLENWGDPRKWDIHTADPSRDHTQGGFNAVQKPSLWRLIENFVNKKRDYGEVLI